MKHLMDSLVNLCQLSTLKALQIYDPASSLSPQSKQALVRVRKHILTGI